MKKSLHLSSKQKNELLDHYRKQQESSSHKMLYFALAACLILAFVFRPSSQDSNLQFTPNDLAQVNEIEQQVDELFTLRKNIKAQSLNQKSKQLSSHLKSSLNKSLSSRLRKSKHKIKSLKQKLT